MPQFKLNWFTKLLAQFFPKLFFRYASKCAGLNPQKITQAQKIFGDAERIDIFPLRGGHRGFIIVLDNKLSLHFYQDGDHFHYDGFEMGKYQDGDVTVFDSLTKEPKSPYG